MRTIFASRSSATGTSSKTLCEAWSRAHNLAGSKGRTRLGARQNRSRTSISALREMRRAASAWDQTRHLVVA
jgi:hypothetical protein